MRRGLAAGALDRWITIQAATHTVDEYGVPTAAWADVATVPAAVINRTAREALREQGAQTTTRVGFRIRWLSGVQTDQRVLFEGRAYNVREVGEIGRRVGLDLICEEVGSG